MECARIHQHERERERKPKSKMENWIRLIYPRSGRRCCGVFCYAKAGCKKKNFRFWLRSRLSMMCWAKPDIIDFLCLQSWNGNEKIACKRSAMGMTEGERGNSRWDVSIAVLGKTKTSPRGLGSSQSSFFGRPDVNSIKQNAHQFDPSSEDGGNELKKVCGSSFLTRSNFSMKAFNACVNGSSSISLSWALVSTRWVHQAEWKIPIQSTFFIS